MRRPIAVAAGVALVAGLGVLAPSSGAGAAGSYTTEVSGSAFRVTTSGGADVVFGCSGDQITIGGVVPSPTMSCSLVAEAVVIGDDGGQTVDARAFDDTATFAQEPRLAASTAGGNDHVYGTRGPDIIQTGVEDDVYTMPGGDTAADTIDLGAGFDVLRAIGTDGDDTIAVSSSASTTTVSFDPGVSSDAQSVAVFVADGGPGDDVLTGAGTAAEAGLRQIDLVGGPGDDQVTGGPASSRLRGGPGTNELITPTEATFESSSDTDTITFGAGSSDIEDLDGPRSGGRTIIGASGSAKYAGNFGDCDVVVRSRPDGPSVRQTASLCRPGQQVLPPVINTHAARFTGTLADRSLFDVVLAPGMSGYAALGDTNDLLDVTVPSGTFHIDDVGGGSKAVITDSPDYGNVDASQIDAISVHGLWTDKAEGFAHRATPRAWGRGTSRCARRASRSPTR